MDSLKPKSPKSNSFTLPSNVPVSGNESKFKLLCSRKFNLKAIRSVLNSAWKLESGDEILAL